MKTFEHDGNRIAYLDEGCGPAVVFVHGTPSSSAEFTEVIGGLKSRYRCIAIDHLGFGESEKPENCDYRLRSHTERLEKLLGILGIDRFHLVAHDFGGAIGLPVALQRWDQVQTLALMNTWAWPLVETEPAMERQKSIMTSGLMRFLYRRFNFSARVLVRAAWGKHRPLTRVKHRRYQRAFPKPSERMGTLERHIQTVDR